ncbi:MAG: type IV pili methyl-accepting chemotaxis transducer N-terminal domain-containing protein [Pseudomonadota bacterium]
MFDKIRPHVAGHWQLCANVLTAATLSLAVAGTATARDILQDVGGSERINLAGQLSTLSQRIMASACNLHAGVAVAESNAVLKISAEQFGRINDALLYGNRSFGILGEEKRPQTLQVIARLSSEWEPVLEDAVATEVNGTNDAQIAQIADQSDALLRTNAILVSEITGQYADPVSLLHADALLIDLAGRQRVFTAQMSKDVCLIASGINTVTAQADLQSSMKLFQDTLSALRNGMEEVGVRPPPTEQIADGLQFVVDEWDAVQPDLQQALNGEQLDAETRQQLFFAFLGMEARMNNVVVMYGKNSKL